MQFLAHSFNEQGNAAFLAGDPAQAERLWRQAVTIDPSFSGAWFNLGLLHKQSRRWTDCLLCNREAVRADPKNRGAWWNLGIAATALRRWPDARRAWAAHQIPLPKGSGAPDSDFGSAPVRLPATSKPGTIVWGRQLDPARVRLEEAPPEDSPFHLGDIVLRDGAPEGQITVEGQSVPIFPVIELWQASGPIP